MIKRHNGPEHHVIIRFGRAVLVRTAEGKIKLINASRGEETAAKEFISLFMHEAVLEVKRK